MTSLFLLLKGWDEDPSLARRVKRESADGNATVLSLDFWAGEALREASIPFERPRGHFDAERGPDLDVLAARLGRSWHAAWEDRLHHRDIPLGQMAEYDFTFLFIDALRSVEIAEHVFETRLPTRVFLSRPTFAQSPNAICHESLPSVVEYLARRQDLPVEWSEPSPIRGSPPTWRERTRDAIFNGMVNSRAFLYSLGSSKAVLFTRISAHDHISPALDGLGLSSLSVPLTRRAWGKTRARARALQPLWGELRRDPAFKEALAYRGVPLSEVLENRFLWFFHNRVPELIAIIEGADWLIRRFEPRILVVPADVTPDFRATSRMFQRRDIPVLVIQHGAVSGDMGGFHVMPIEGGRQAVWGELPRDWHINRGKSPKSQAVTGNPGFDPIARKWNSAEGGVRRRLGLDPQKGIILVATESFSGISSLVTTEDEEMSFRITLRALRQFPHHQVVVKLHPSYQTEYRDIVLAVASEEAVQIVLAYTDLWDLLDASDVVLIFTSTVGLEAMILDKPVVVVRAYEGTEEVPYVTSGAALGASESSEITRAVERVLYDAKAMEAMAEAREAFVASYAHKQDGRASERVARLIQRMIRETHS